RSGRRTARTRRRKAGAAPDGRGPFGARGLAAAGAPAPQRVSAAAEPLVEREHELGKARCDVFLGDTSGVGRGADRDRELALLGGLEDQKRLLVARGLDAYEGSHEVDHVHRFLLALRRGWARGPSADGPRTNEPGRARSDAEGGAQAPARLGEDRTRWASPTA